MSITCTFHPSKSAHFECPECNTAFCESCYQVKEVGTPGLSKRFYFCPGCHVELMQLDLSGLVKPFHQNLTEIFRYVLKPTPLIYSAVLALFSVLFSSGFFGIGGSILGTLFVWVLMMKYAYAALLETGQGDFSPPTLTSELVTENLMQTLWQVLLFFILFSIGGLLMMVHIVLVVVYGILVVISLPAMIMLLVTSNSIFNALNPVYIFGLMSRIGPAYILLLLFLFFLLLAPAGLLALLPKGLLPPLVLAVISAFLQQIYLIISYHMMGYVLLQFHQNIGYSVDYETLLANRTGKRRKVGKPDPEKELQAGLTVLTHCGKYEEAIELLLPFINIDDPKTEHSEKFLQLLKITRQQDRYVAYCQRHLTLLVARGLNKKALQLYKTMAEEKQPSPSGEVCLHIGLWLSEQRDFRDAMQMYSSFLATQKKDTMRGKIYFEAAKLLHEQMNKTLKAKQILASLIKNRTDPSLASAAKAYLAQMS